MNDLDRIVIYSIIACILIAIRCDCPRIYSIAIGIALGSVIGNIYDYFEVKWMKMLKKIFKIFVQLFILPPLNQGREEIRKNISNFRNLWKI